MEDKKIKVWMFLTEKGELVGEGQGSNEYFYTKEAAEAMLAEMSEIPDGASKGTAFIRNIFAKWKIVPCEIIYPA